MNEQAMHEELDECTKDRTRPDDADVWLGMRMRQVRKGRGLSLQAVADRAGLSVGLVSQIERGLTSPSIRSLRALSSALDVPVSWFFHVGEPEQSRDHGIVVRPQNRRLLNLRQKGIVKEILSPGLSENIEMMIVHVDPGGSSGPDPYHHQGDECGLVLSGNLELWIEDNCFMLNEGDSFTFESTRPHRFVNPGKHPAQVLWVVTPPIY